MSLRSNLLKSGVASIVQKIVRLLEQVFLIPFFINKWGTEYYGEWLSLTIIPSILVFSDLGIGTSAANRFILKYVSGDIEGARTTAKNGLFVLHFVVLFGILLTIVLLYILNCVSVFDKILIPKYQVIFSLLLVMIARIINFYNQFYEAFYRAARKASLSMYLQSIYSFMLIVAGLLVLIWGGRVVEYAISTLLITILFNPLYNWKARKILPLKGVFNSKIIKDEILIILKHGLGFLLSPVWQAIFFQGTTLAVRITLGPIAVTTFNTVRTLTRAINQFFNMLTIGVFPEFQYQIARNNMRSAQDIFKVVLFATVVIALVFSSILHYWGIQIYEFWTNKVLIPPKEMWDIFILGIIVNAIWWVGTIVFQAFNKPFLLTIPCTIVSIISVLLTYILSSKFGLLGASIGAVMLDILLVFYILPTSCKILGLPVQSLFTNIYKSYKSIREV